MKKVKNKYIRLTEEQLKSIIKECVQKELSLITEYAIKRKEFKFRFFSLLPQIIQNWFLIHYCTLSNTDVNKCKEHWKTELYALLDTIADDDIKGNNSYDSRFKAIMEVFAEKEYETNPKKILKTFTIKFNKEQIPFDKEMFDTLIKDFIANMKNIADVIASKNIEEYIENI